ncbi:MAG: hypothetical protein ISS74_05195 [Planctomycetes bacterium]|nr:hypothetical protein [Planctomycetota bacterium]
MRRVVTSVVACRTIGCLVALVALALLAGPLWAARVITKDGAVFDGVILSKDGGRVVVRTSGGGQITIPADKIHLIEGESDDAPPPEEPRIIPAQVQPRMADDAFREAKDSLKSGKWERAGALLEGLLALDPPRLSKRELAEAANGLITCYLRVEDPVGVGKTLLKSMQFAATDEERKRYQTAAEGLRAMRDGRLAGKKIESCQELVDASFRWKGEQLVDEARQIASNASLLSVSGRLERTATQCVARLEQADQYLPGSSSRHREQFLRMLPAKVMDTAKQAADACTQERDWLNENRWRSWADNETVKAWIARIMGYLSARQQADDAVRNLLNAPSLKDLFNRGEAEDLLKRLDGLKYYPPGILQILPRRTGQPPKKRK